MREGTPPRPGVPAGGAALEFFGEAVADPQRWLEALDGDAARDWVAQQDLAASAFLETHTRIADCRTFMQRNFRCVDPPWEAVRGERRYFLSRRSGQAELSICLREADGTERVLVDPNALGEVLASDTVAVSPTGRYVGYGLSKSGGVLNRMEVYDVEAGGVVERIPDATLAPMIAWHPEELGFYYSRCRRLCFPEERGDGLYWHPLGADGAADPCVKAYADGPGHLAYAVVASTHLVVFTVQFSTGRSGVSLCDRDRTWPVAPAPADTQTLFEDLECVNFYLGEASGRHYFQTTLEAPMGRIVAIDAARPARSEWTTVVAERALAIARPEHFPAAAKCAVSEDALLVTFVEHAHEVVWHFDATGHLEARLDFPVFSTVDAIVRTGDHFRIFAQSFLEPRVMFRYRAGAEPALVELERVAIPDVDASAVEVRQVFFTARDGTLVPMYLIHRTGRSPETPSAVLLYGYGGFTQSITPEYMPEIALWLELGGMYAVANIRGGGEYGEAWHAAGTREHKQTCFDDFYAAAEYLIAEGYTEPRRLAIKGISNGGLLTAVSVNQRPDLFAAVVSEVPLVDVLTLDRTAPGRSVTGEYGSPLESRTMFETMRSYSPLHNVRADGAGPPQWVVAAESDFSAPPAQACRFVAERQERLRACGRDIPVLLRFLQGVGHTNWPQDVRRTTVAEELAFLNHFTADP